MKIDKKVRMSTSSQYLLTILFKVPFFKRMKNWEIFAFLIPYVDGYGNPFPSSEEGIKNKMKMLKEGTLGGQIQNAATQGFSRNGLHSPSISFPYYYEQLSKMTIYLQAEYRKHEQEIRTPSWNAWDAEDSNIESETMKQSIQEMLMLPKLYYRRNHEVYNHDKCVLLEHLSKYGNQYVLAEILYYITSASHELPNVDVQIRNQMSERLSAKIITQPNVACGLRSDFDETIEEMKKKLEDVKKLKLLCLSGSAFFDEKMDSETGTFFSLLENRILKENPIEIQVIFQSPNTKTAVEAAKNRMAPNCPKVSKIELISSGISGLTKLKRLADSCVSGKCTKIQIPYTLCFYYFYEPFFDYVKVDVYSPLISADDSRPSMIVFRQTNQKLFTHFEETFQKIWNREEDSLFLW